MNGFFDGAWMDVHRRIGIRLIEFCVLRSNQSKREQALTITSISSPISSRRREREGMMARAGSTTWSSLPVGLLLHALLLAHLLPVVCVTGKEYCLDEIVNMQCGSDEVLLVESAKFGRMQLGRCVKADYGYIGCGSDVTDILAGKCSGRRHCRIFNLEVLFSGKKVCPQDLKSYLEANFRCAKVVVPGPTTSCLQSGQITIQSSSAASGLIASITSHDHGVGNSSCPWVIEASPGQRINLTALDFTEYGGGSSYSVEQDLHPGSDSTRRVCRGLAVVEEVTALNNLITCNNQPRSSVVYSSKTNRLRLSLNVRNLEDDRSNFVIKYDVYGCPHPTSLPPNTHLVTNDLDDSIRIQCNHSQEFWILHCGRNGSWNGHLGNCSLVSLAEVTNFDRFSYGMSLLLVLVVAISICFIFLASGLLCLYRSKRLQRSSRAKHRLVVSLPSYSPDRGHQDPAKASTVPRPQPLGRTVYCHLDPKCAAPSTIDETPVFHTLQESGRRPIPVSTPIMHRTGSRQQVLLHHHRPPCSCTVRFGSLLPFNSSSISNQTRPGIVEQPPDGDCTNHPPSTFTTFKPASPENEYGTPKPRVNRLCHDPHCCSRGPPTDSRRADGLLCLTTIQAHPEVFQNSSNEGNVTV